MAARELSLARLEALRSKSHRTDPSRPIRDGRGAAAFVAERRMVMAEGHSSLAVLTHAIAGREIRGSWMADPEVHRIYRVWMSLGKYDFPSVRLVSGKEVLIDPTLGPAVERVASDTERIERSREQLPALARRLLEAIESEGEVRMDRWDAPTRTARPARLSLEKELLVVSQGLHTERGYHTAIVRPWIQSAFSKRFRKAASRVAIEEAEAALLAAAIRSAVVAPAKEIEKWFVFGASRIDDLVAKGAAGRLVEAGKTWIYFTPAGTKSPGG